MAKLYVTSMTTSEKTKLRDAIALAQHQSGRVITKAERLEITVKAQTEIITARALRERHGAEQENQAGSTFNWSESIHRRRR